MDRIWIGTFLVLIFLIGLFHLKNKLRIVRMKLTFLIKFHNNFIKLADSLTYTISFGIAPSIDQNLYNWLVRNSTKAQRYVNKYEVSEMISPMQLLRIIDYQIILNILPKIRSGWVHKQEIATVDGCLMRSIGTEEELEHNLVRDIRNPIIWLKHGVRLMITFPILILKWLGVIPENIFEYLVRNYVFKLLSVTITIITLISSIVGLVTGWKPFLEIIKDGFDMI